MPAGSYTSVHTPNQAPMNFFTGVYRFMEMFCHDYSWVLSTVRLVATISHGCSTTTLTPVLLVLYILSLHTAGGRGLQATPTPFHIFLLCSPDCQLCNRPVFPGSSLYSSFPSH